MISWFKKQPATVADRAIFICGCGHSGTTLVLKLLGHHSKLHALRKETGFGSRGCLMSDIENFRREAEHSGKLRWVEKTPSNVHYVQEIRSRLPNSLFVFTRRDGLDNIASLARQRYSIEDAANRWLDDNAQVDRWLAEPWSYLIKYEDLVVDLDKEIRSLLSFCGESYEPNCARPEAMELLMCGLEETRIRDQPLQEHKERRNSQVNSPIFDGRGSHKEILSVEQIAWVCEKIDNVRRKYGYV